MNTQRIIPVLLNKDGRLILSRKFEFHQDIGDAYQITDRLKTWDVDELVYLNITPYWSTTYDFEDFVRTIQTVSNNCFVPLTAGGGIKTLDQIHQLISAGADRIILNSIAYDNPNFITEAAHVFGSQAIIVCMDIKYEDGSYKCFSHGGKKEEAKSPEECVKMFQELGAGELVIQSIDHDGQGNGYDLNLLTSISKATTLPLIALGGAGKWDDLSNVLEKGIGATAAANIFAFEELSYKASKDKAIKHKLTIRPGSLGVDYKAARNSHDTFNTEKNELWANLKQSGLME